MQKLGDVWVCVLPVVKKILQEGKRKQPFQEEPNLKTLTFHFEKSIEVCFGGAKIRFRMDKVFLMLTSAFLLIGFVFSKPQMSKNFKVFNKRTMKKSRVNTQVQVHPVADPGEKGPPYPENMFCSAVFRPIHTRDEFSTY